MDNNPLNALIQGLLILFLLWSVPIAWYVVLNHRLIAKQYHLIVDLHNENKALRAELARYKRPQPPEWAALFSDMPSDPRLGALN